MAGVQDTSPKDLNPFSLQTAEEGSLFEPPRGCPGGELRQPLLCQTDVLVNVYLHVGLLADRQKLLHRRFLGADELSEEAPLGEKLVDQDGANRVGRLVRLEVEESVWHGPPHAHGFVRLAGIGGDDVLEDWLNRLGDFSVGDGDEVVVRGRLLSHPSRPYFRFLRLAAAFAESCFTRSFTIRSIRSKGIGSSRGN